MNSDKLAEELLRLSSEIDIEGRKYASAKASYENLKESSKDVLAVMMSGFSGSEAKCEREARCTESWERHQKNLMESRLSYYLSDSKYNSLKIKHESIRSVLSLEKTKISIL